MVNVSASKATLCIIYLKEGGDSEINTVFVLFGGSLSAQAYSWPSAEGSFLAGNGGICVVQGIEPWISCVQGKYLFSL